MFFCWIYGSFVFLYKQNKQKDSSFHCKADNILKAFGQYHSLGRTANLDVILNKQVSAGIWEKRNSS